MKSEQKEEFYEAPEKSDAPSKLPLNLNERISAVLKKLPKLNLNEWRSIVEALGEEENRSSLNEESVNLLKDSFLEPDFFAKIKENFESRQKYNQQSSSSENSGATWAGRVSKRKAETQENANLEL